MRLLIICDQMPTLTHGGRTICYAVKGVPYFNTSACLEDYDGHVVLPANNSNIDNSNIDLDKLDIDKLGVNDIHILLRGMEAFLFTLITDQSTIEKIGKEITKK